MSSLPCSVRLFGLSTCVHCSRAKAFLEEHQVPLDCVYLDKLEGEKRSEVIEEVRHYNPKLSFPTIVCADGKVVVGFKEEALKEALAL